MKVPVTFCPPDLPIQVTTAGLPVEGDMALVGFQSNKTSPKFQLNLIHLPHNDHRQQGHRDQGGQMKKSIQKFVHVDLAFWQVN